MAVYSSATHLVIGLGEVGTALHSVLGGKYPVFTKDLGGESDISSAQILHIAFPYDRNFTYEVKRYIGKYAPGLVIVYSTVPIGTCNKIGEKIVHSPVEGRHPNLADSLLKFPRWLGCSDLESLEIARGVWEPLNPKIRTLGASEHSEWLKLRSTAKYGVNIAWTDYEARISEKLGMDFEELQLFDTDYNEFYKDDPAIQRYILDPPNGEIGGHCIRENSILLDRQHPHPMLKEIKKMRKK